MLNNNFSYTQLSFFFLLQKDYFFNHHDTDVFFLFFFRKILIALSGHLSLFFSFFFRKILTSFTCFFSKNLFVFLIIFSNHFCICIQKNHKTKLLVTLVLFKFSSKFFPLEFSSWEFSLSELEQISILSIICLGIFFYLTTDLHSSKNTWG